MNNLEKKCTQTTPKGLLNPLVCLKSKIVSIFEKRLKLNVEEPFLNLIHMKLNPVTTSAFESNQLLHDIHGLTLSTNSAETD